MVKLRTGSSPLEPLLVGLITVFLVVATTNNNSPISPSPFLMMVDGASSSLTELWKTSIDLSSIPLPKGATGSPFLSGGASQVFLGTAKDVVALDAKTGNTSWSKAHGAPAGYDLISIEANDESGNVLAIYAPGNSAGNSFPPGPDMIIAHRQTTGDIAFTIKIPGFNNSVRQIQRNERTVVKVDAAYLGNPTNTMRLEAWSLATGELIFNVTQSGIIFINGLGVGTNFVVVNVYSENSIHNNDYVFDLATGQLKCFGVSEYASSPFQKPARVPTFENGLILGQGRQNARSSHSFVMNSSCWRLDGEPVSKRIIDGEAFNGYSVVGDGLFAAGYSAFHGYDTNSLANWEVQLPQGSSSHIRVASRLPGNPEAVVANMQGALSAVNRTTGSILWQTSTTVAAMPFSNDEYHNNPVQVYPLRKTAEAIFIPHPTGYAVMNTTDGKLLSTSTVSTTTFGTAVFLFEKAVVVYADQRSNTVSGYVLN